MLDSSVKTSTRGAFLETADLLAQEGIDVPLIIGGGAIDGAFAGQRENIAICQRSGGAGGGAGCDCAGKREMNPAPSWARHQRKDLLRLKERLGFDIQIDLTGMFLIRRG